MRTLHRIKKVCKGFATDSIRNGVIEIKIPFDFKGIVDDNDFCLGYEYACEDVLSVIRNYAEKGEDDRKLKFLLEYPGLHFVAEEVIPTLLKDCRTFKGMPNGKDKVGDTNTKESL